MSSGETQRRREGTVSRVSVHALLQEVGEIGETRDTEMNRV